MGSCSSFSFEKGKVKKMLVVNLFAGPCTGKSSVASGVFSLLKSSSVNCELVTEVSKDMIWNGSEKALKYQPYIFGNQAWRIERLNDMVDIVITDSPILLSTIYAKDMPKCFHDLVLHEHNRHKSFNIFLNRTEAFDETGRVHSLEESIDLDNQIKTLLIHHDIDFTEFSVNKATPWIIFESIMTYQG